MYYAQITNGVVTAVSELAGEINAANMVQIDGLDTALLGKAYEAGEFVDVVPPVVADPCEWLIDKGPFFDRFGAAKMDVLTSTDPVIKAILVDIGARHWIDLQRADVASSLAYVGTVVPAVDAAMQTAILTTPVDLVDNLALRKLFFA